MSIVEPFGGVHAVRYGYVPHVVFGEINLRKTARFKIISAKPGKVFCDNAVDFSVLDIRQHTLKARSVGVRSAPAVVNVDLADCKAVFTAVACEHFLLRLYGSELSLMVPSSFERRRYKAVLYLGCPVIVNLLQTRTTDLFDIFIIHQLSQYFKYFTVHYCRLPYHYFSFQIC